MLVSGRFARRTQENPAVDIETFFKLAHQFRRLGDAVGSQILAVVDGEDIEEQNPAAMQAALPLFNALARAGVKGAADLRDQIVEEAV
jgi:hypothetical protein